MLSPRVVLAVSLCLTALAPISSARAEDAATYGPGKVWCASQTVCHLHVSDFEDYGFNGLTLPPTQQQALLGPCQVRKDCTALLSGDEIPHVHLLTNVQIARWVNAPPEFNRTSAVRAAASVSAASASAGKTSDRRR